MRRERWTAIAIALAIVAVRSAVFLIRPETYFDSDQATVGLMAKHLAELRAFPVFLYGQTYMASKRGSRRRSLRSSACRSPR